MVDTTYDVCDTKVTTNGKCNKLPKNLKRKHDEGNLPVDIEPSPYKPDGLDFGFCKQNAYSYANNDVQSDDSETQMWVGYTGTYFLQTIHAMFFLEILCYSVW